MSLRVDSLGSVYSLRAFTNAVIADLNSILSSLEGHYSGLNPHTSTSIMHDNETLKSVLDHLTSKLEELSLVADQIPEDKALIEEKMAKIEELLRLKTDTSLNGYTGEITIKAGAGITLTEDQTTNTIVIEDNNAIKLIGDVVDEYTRYFNLSLLTEDMRLKLDLVKVDIGVFIRSSSPLIGYKLEDRKVKAFDVPGNHEKFEVPESAVLRAASSSTTELVICKLLDDNPNIELGGE